MFLTKNLTRFGGGAAAASLYGAMRNASHSSAETPTAIAPKKVCLIVGLGGGGIGEACATKFLKEGFTVAMVARRAETLTALEAKLGPDSKSYVGDASSSPEVVH
jgi:shikimate 5-dehydrogenase